MLRPLVKISFGFILLFTVFSTASRITPLSQPINPALAGFTTDCEGRTHLCWYGIVPGVTTVDEARQILIARDYIFAQPGIESLGYLSFKPVDSTLACEFEIYFQDTTIQEMALLTCAKVKLGDLVPIFGVPNKITGLGIALFGDNRVWVELPYLNKTECWDLNPASDVSMIRMVPQETIDSSYSFFRQEPTVDWKGLLPFFAYVRLYDLKCRAL